MQLIVCEEARTNGSRHIQCFVLDPGFFPDSDFGSGKPIIRILGSWMNNHFPGMDTSVGERAMFLCVHVYHNVCTIDKRKYRRNKDSLHYWLPRYSSIFVVFKKRCEPHDVDFREGYGMTESSPVSPFQPQENAVLGGCGLLVPNTIAKIVDITTGAALGPSEDGELCVAGPQVMKGYHDNPKATKQTVMKCWLHTGDIAKYNEDGQFFIIDQIYSSKKQLQDYRVLLLEIYDKCISLN